MRCVLAICLVGCIATAWGQAAVPTTGDTPASKEDIMRLFTAMKIHEQTQRMTEQVFKQMQVMQRDQLRKRDPNITAEGLARMEKESEDLLKNFPIDDLILDEVPIYQKH